MNPIKITTWLKENKKVWQIWHILLFLSLMFTVMQKKKPTESLPERADVDTLIPEGFVLAPVELSNGPSLDGLLDSKGVVDLYTGDPIKQKAEKVASSVKILRSPLNPKYFAVLVPENEAKFLIQRFQAFHAVLQNPGQKRKAVIRDLHRQKKRRSVIIDIDN